MTLHKTNLGKFGEGLRADLDGYVHTDARGWMRARLDGMVWNGYGYNEKRERCVEMAREARKALRDAREALGRWQDEN